MTSIRDAYATMQWASNIKVGDRVKILRKFKDYEMGVGDCWNPRGEMDYTVGKTGRVCNVDSNRIRVKFEDGKEWNYPFFVLELVVDTPQVEIAINRGNAGSIHCVNEDVAQKVEEVLKKA